ncbi:MAG: metallophosphoesterase, partial [Chloroflexota bacterium]
MFDRSLLPPAELEFVVMADTHYMLGAATPNVGGATEFASRSSQTARVERVLQLVASLGLPVVHLGDIVQEFPERPGFQQSMAEATAQIARWGLTPYQVAGNHDVGDKPDPTMPTDWVTADSLAQYHARFGRSWHSFDLGPLHGIVLNAQIFNCELPEAEAQRQWLAAELAAQAGRRLAIFLHIPLFLRDEDEPALGHYDNIDQPDRTWLLELIRQYQVELVFAGHSHYAFANRLGQTRYFVAASTTFTRPGFGELFSAAPPPDRGRDDTPKLGFYLLRLRGQGIRVHFQRTAGETGTQPDDDRRQRLVTLLPADLPASPLGISLRHTLTTRLEVPAAWPSVVRQPVRNDYPLLTTLELGARRVLVPVTDLDDALQQERLAVLRDEGVEVTGWALWHQGLTPPLEQIARHRGRLDGLTVHLLGETLPDAACLEGLARLREATGCPVTLSTIVAREQVPGKQHDRSRHGYRPDELPDLSRRLAQHVGQPVDRVLSRVAPNASPWDSIVGQSSGSLPEIGGLDWLVELSTDDDDAHLVRVSEAIFAAAAAPRCRVLLDPLVDLDRTMDTFHGLLDRRCNPRSPFHAARVLNSLLFG